MQIDLLLNENVVYFLSIDMCLNYFENGVAMNVMSVMGHRIL